MYRREFIKGLLASIVELVLPKSKDEMIVGVDAAVGKDESAIAGCWKGDEGSYMWWATKKPIACWPLDGHKETITWTEANGGAVVPDDIAKTLLHWMEHCPCEPIKLGYYSEPCEGWLESDVLDFDYDYDDALDIQPSLQEALDSIRLQARKMIGTPVEWSFVMSPEDYEMLCKYLEKYAY